VLFLIRKFNSIYISIILVNSDENFLVHLLQAGQPVLTRTQSNTTERPIGTRGQTGKAINRLLYTVRYHHVGINTKEGR
jgi:hypothetical protein